MQLHTNYFVPGSTFEEFYYKYKVLPATARGPRGIGVPDLGLTPKETYGGERERELGIIWNGNKRCQ